MELFSLALWRDIGMCIKIDAILWLEICTSSLMGLCESSDEVLTLSHLKYTLFVFLWLLSIMPLSILWSSTFLNELVFRLDALLFSLCRIILMYYWHFWHGWLPRPLIVLWLMRFYCYVISRPSLLRSEGWREQLRGWGLVGRLLVILTQLYCKSVTYDQFFKSFSNKIESSQYNIAITLSRVIKGLYHERLYQIIGSILILFFCGVVPLFSLEQNRLSQFFRSNISGQWNILSYNRLRQMLLISLQRDLKPETCLKISDLDCHREVPLFECVMLFFNQGCWISIQYNLLERCCKIILTQPWTQVMDY